ncbi:uncharacterized protein LOC100871173 isoform X5 [Apis florea]|uniref:uncharacterized protein LOC100871173 isoform X5 n=1 Tax=Apis florea TaxID=7463 RepID=UPI0006297EBC|nr:uncharacterized protein LOC100871173 isoform X5 [Apis florea]
MLNEEIDFHWPLFHKHFRKTVCYFHLVSSNLEETFDEMGMLNIDIRQVLYILELTGTFTCTWPINPNDSKKYIIIRNILWTFTILNVIFLIISLMLAIFHFRSDIPKSMKTASEMTALLEVVLDLVLCKWNNTELQVLIEEVRSFLEIANEYEIKILQGYINRYKKFFSTVSMGYILPASSFILMPLFSAQELPAEGWLPFSIEPLGIYCVVYVNHIYCILQTSFCIFVDFTIVILFSFPAAKLDVLRSKLRHVNNYDMLVSCIKEHQKILGINHWAWSLSSFLWYCQACCTCSSSPGRQTI